MRFANTILVTVLAATIQQQSSYAFSPIPKYQQVSAAAIVSSSRGDTKKLLRKDNVRGRVDVHQYITSNNNEQSDINNSEYQSLKGAAASIILGTVTATQLSVGLASAAYIDDTDVQQVASSATISDSVVVNKQQSSISPFNKEDRSTLDSSINHFLLVADSDTATLEKKEEVTTDTNKVTDETKKLEEKQQKAEAAAAKKKADDAKKVAEEADKKKVEEQKIAEQKAKDEASTKVQSEQKAKEEIAKAKESSTTKSTTEEQALLNEGDELIKDKIQRIAATKQAEEAEEQLIKEKQDKIDKLYAEQKARSTTITKLKTAKEQAIQQKLTNQQTETNKRLELDKLLSNAEQYRINTAESERLIQLDIKLTQLELVAYEERIETIQEQVNKLEKLNDDTSIILEKLGVKGEDLPKVDESTAKKAASTRTSSSLSVKPKTTSSSISGLSSGSDESSISSDLSPVALGVISIFITAGTVAGAYFFNDNDDTDSGGMLNDPMGFGNTSGGGPSFPPSQGGPGLNENGFGSNADSSYPPSQSNNAQGNTFGGGASGFSPPAMKGQEQSNSGFGSMGGMNKAQSGGTPSFGTRAQPPSTGFGTSSSSSPPQSGGSAGFGQQQGGMNKTSFGNSSAFGNKGSIGKTSSPLSGGTSFGQQQSSGFGNITPANTMKGPQSTSNAGFGSSKGFGQQKSAGFSSPGSMKGGTSSAPAFGSSSGGFVSKRDSMKGGETKQQSGGTPSFNSSSTFGGDNNTKQQSGGTPSFSSPSISLKGSQGEGTTKSTAGSSAFPSGGTSFGGANMMKGKEAGSSKQSFGSSSSFGSPTDKNKQPGGFGTMKGPPVTVEKGKGAGSGFTTLDKKSPTSSQGSGGMMKGTSSAGKDSSSSAPSYGSKGGFVSKRDSMKSWTDSTTEKKGGEFGSSSVGLAAKVQSGGTPSFSSGGLGNTAMKGSQSSSSPPGFSSAGGFISKRDSMKGDDKKLQSGGTPSFSSVSTSGGDKKQSGGTPSFGSSFESPKGGIDSKKSSVGSTAFSSGGTSFGGVNMMKGKEAGSTTDKKSNSFTMKNTPKSTQPGGFENTAKGAGSGFTSLDKKSSSSPGSGFDSKKTSDSVGFGSGGMMKGTASSPFAASSKSSTGPGMLKDSSSPFKMGSTTEKGAFGSPQKGKEGLDAKMSKKSSVGASAFPLGGTSFGGVNMMKGKEAGPSPGKKSFGSSPAFGKKMMSDKGIISPMDSKKTSSFTMKGSTDSSGMKMDSSSSFKMGDKGSFGSPKGKGGVSLDTNKMGKKSSVGASAFQSGGTSFGGVNMMKGKEAGTPGNKQPGMDAVKSVQSTGMKKSFGNSPAFGGKKMSDKGITSPAMDSKKSASAFTMKGSVDSNKMSPPKSTFGSTPKTMNKASFGAGTPPKSMDSKSFSMKGSMDNKQSSFGAGTPSKSFGSTSPMDNKMKSGMDGIGMKGGLGSDMKGSLNSKQPGGMNSMPPMKGGIGGPMKGMDTKQPGNLGGSNMPPSKGIGGLTAKSGSFAMKGMDNKQPGAVMPPPKTFGSSLDGKKSPSNFGGPNKTMAVNVKGRNISTSKSLSMDNKMSSPGSMDKTSTMKGSTGGSSAFGANGMSPSQPKLGQKSNTMGQQSAVMKGQSSEPGPSFNKSPGSTSPNKAFGTASINSQMLDGFSSPVSVSPGSTLGSSSQGFSKQSVSSFRDGGASNQAESYRASNEMGNSGSYDTSYQGYDNSMDEYGSSQGYDNSMNSSYDQGGQMNSDSMGQDYYTDDYYTDDYSSDNSMRDFRDG